MSAGRPRAPSGYARPTTGRGWPPPDRSMTVTLLGPLQDELEGLRTWFERRTAACEIVWLICSCAGVTLKSLWASAACVPLDQFASGATLSRGREAAGAAARRTGRTVDATQHPDTRRRCDPFHRGSGTEAPAPGRHCRSPASRGARPAVPESAEEGPSRRGSGPLPAGRAPVAAAASRPPPAQGRSFRSCRPSGRSRSGRVSVGRSARWPAARRPGRHAG